MNGTEILRQWEATVKGQLLPSRTASRPRRWRPRAWAWPGARLAKGAASEEALAHSRRVRDEIRAFVEQIEAVLELAC